MDLLPTPTRPTTPALPTAVTDSVGTQMTSDFEVFLKMLTAQMQYQDPLNPVDSTDYATQLATFSGVEQAVQTNDLLKTLTTQMTSGGLTDLASWVGREARTSGPAYFEGTPISLYPGQLGAADSTEIIVQNAAGDEVQRFAYASGTESVTWAGVGADGSPMPDGLYSFQAVAKSNGEVASLVPVDTYARVNEVRLQNGQTMVILEGGATVPSGDISALRAF